MGSEHEKLNRVRSTEEPKPSGQIIKILTTGRVKPASGCLMAINELQTLGLNLERFTEVPHPEIAITKS